MNVDNVAIETDNELSPEERAALLAQEEEKLERSFARVTRDPILVAFKKAILEGIRKEYQDQEEEPPAEKAKA